MNTISSSASEPKAFLRNIVFDLPGVGGSPLPASPYRPSGIARLSARLVSDLGYSRVDVAGVSWGGGMAQQFAHQYSGICRRRNATVR